MNQEDFINKIPVPNILFSSYEWNEEKNWLEFYDEENNIVGYYFPKDEKELKEFLSMFEL